MSLVTFVDNTALSAGQLNQNFSSVLLSTSATPLVLTGAGTQLTVNDTASIVNLVVSGSNSFVTQSQSDNSTKAATTAWVTTKLSTAGSFSASSVAITGGTINGTSIGGTTPSTGAFSVLTAPTKTAGDSSTNVATTAFVAASFAPLLSPTFTGSPVCTTPSAGDNSTRIATTAFVQNVMSAANGFNPASSNISGGTINGTTIGNTTPAAGTFTTLSATGGINGTIIGGTTPAAGTFSTLAATSGLNNTAIGNTTPSTGVFTALTVSNTLTTTGARVRNARLFTNIGSVAMTTADDILLIQKGTPATTAVTLPASPSFGRHVTIKDAAGNAGSFNITITPASGTIDGQTSATISSNYGSIDLVYNGSSWSII